MGGAVVARCSRVSGRKRGVWASSSSKGLEVGGRKGERGGGFIPEFHRQLDLLRVELEGAIRVELEGATRVEMFGTFRVDLEDFFLDLRCGRSSLGPPGGATGATKGEVGNWNTRGVVAAEQSPGTRVLSPIEGSTSTLTDSLS